MAIFQRAGMRKGGLPLPLAFFIYLMKLKTLSDGILKPNSNHKIFVSK